MINKKNALLLVFALAFWTVNAQQIALLKYNGGGDWYANPTSLPNLVKYCNKTINTTLNTTVATVTPSSAELFNYPFVHITGHGNIVFSEAEAENMRNYLMAGGFLHISDNYGLDKYIRKAMKTVFPELTFQEIPNNHPIFHQKFDFNNGLPKIHEHDGKRPQAFGLFYKGRLLCFYDYECDLGDGWEDEAVHHDPLSVREKALQMGANIISYIFNN